MSAVFPSLCAVPDSAPVNVSVALNGTEVLLQWDEPIGKLNGDLQGYMVEYSTPHMEQVRQA